MRLLDTEHTQSIHMRAKLGLYAFKYAYTEHTQLHPTLGALAGVTPAAKAAKDILSSSGVGADCGVAPARLSGAAVCGEGGLRVSHWGNLWAGSGLHGMAWGDAAAAALPGLLAGLGLLPSAPSLLGLGCTDTQLLVCKWDAIVLEAATRGQE